MSPTALVLALVLMAPSGAGDDARARKSTEEILKLLNVEASVSQVKEQMKKMIAAQVEAAEIPEEDREDFAKHLSAIFEASFEEMSFEKMKDDYIDIYVRTFTPGELDGLLAFYRSPVGSRFIQKLPELMQASLEVSMKRAQEMMPRIQKAVEEMLREPRGNQKKEQVTAMRLRSAGSAIEAYAVDRDRYPGPTKGFVDLVEVQKDLEPSYIKELPLADGWGTPLLILSTGDAYWIVSAGEDGTFDRDYRSVADPRKDLPGSGVAAPGGDIIYSNGTFHSWPEGLVP